MDTKTKEIYKDKKYLKKIYEDNLLKKNHLQRQKMLKIIYLPSPGMAAGPSDGVHATPNWKWIF